MTIFGASWMILGAIWSQAGRQGAPKILHFGTKSAQKSKKWRPGRGLRKSLKFGSKFDRKMEAFEVLKPSKIVCFTIETCFRRFSRNIENLIEKWRQHGSQNPSEIEILRSRIWFLRFWWDFWRVWFLMKLLSRGDTAAPLGIGHFSEGGWK